MNSKRHMNIPVFIPHKGCPNECVFCNQRAIAGQIGDVGAADVRKTVEEYLRYAEGKTVEIAFFGGSFTGLDLDYQRELLSAAHEYVKKGAAVGIRLSTRPDYIDEKRLSLLKEYGVTVIELGVQSMDNEVLAASRRGHTAEDVIRAAGLIHGFGITLGVQMMTGLPGDTREKSLKTAHSLVGLRPCLARIYPTLVIRGTYLEELFLKGLYTPQSLEEAVALAAELTEIFARAHIKVIRTGLQESESLLCGLVAGPYKSDFGEMVQSRIYRNKMEEYIKKSGAREITIKAPKTKISQVIGNKRSNILYLAETYNVKINVDITDGKFSIN